jgi:pimeloyl-ACP methyl ester carboxylesterase
VNGAERATRWLEVGDYFEWTPPTGAEASHPLRIFHAEFGNEELPFLLLVHGFPTSSIDWHDVCGSLSERYRVGVVDFPGFGFSDKPPRHRYTVADDALLLSHYLTKIVGVGEVSVVAHDRGDSVALSFVSRVAAGELPLVVRHLVLSNGNMFLPLSNLTTFQRLVLHSETASGVLDVLTPAALAAGMGLTTFSPPRTADDATVAALAETFACNDGIAVLHDTIQYLVERAQSEEQWLQKLSGLSVPTAVVWGILDTISPLRVATHIWHRYLATKPGDNSLWLLPNANHYLQNDQPAEFAAVVKTVLQGETPETPGATSTEPGAPVLFDRSRVRLPGAGEVLARG